jgi:hypothetical protein
MDLDRHKKVIDALISAVGNSPGSLDVRVRQDLLLGKVGATALGFLANKVMFNPASIGGEYIKELISEGISEDQIFESVIASALGAGLQRLRSGLALLQEE